ncbi:MAG: glutamine synthetase family protein [Thermofilaceae archaeon]
MPEVNTSSILRILKNAGVKRLMFIITDIFGKPRGVSFSIKESLKVLKEGLCFDGSSLPKYAPVHESDILAKPDLSSLYVDPSVHSAWVFCSVVEPSSAKRRDPRWLLFNATQALRESRFKVKVGIEVEFFLVKMNGGEVKPVDTCGYFDISAPALSVVEEIASKAERAGLGAVKAHHEVAPGQYECVLPAANPVKACDTFLLFKELASTTALSYGLRVTFMPKPFWGVNGSGAHVHLSLYKDGVNVFRFKGEFSREGFSCIAGLLQMSRSIAALAAPTVNSYKRLIPHHEAPTRIAWGYGNRTTLIRVPLYQGAAERVEFRQPDPLMNPYLTVLTVIKSMLNGLVERLESPPPVTVSAYELEGLGETPRHLGEAADEFANTFNQLGIPTDLAELYLKCKREEWKEYLQQCGSWEETWNKVTSWEYSRYL